jgi:serine protease
MPVRVLDTQGEGEASTIAKGVRFAVNHGARVINLSLEFAPSVTAGEIPELISAIRDAHKRGVLVVGAAGNEAHKAIAYPARAPYVVSVGATTEHGCLAAYSNDGSGLRRGPAEDRTQPARRPQLPPRTALRARHLPGDPEVAHQGIRDPRGYEGTSMPLPCARGAGHRQRRARPPPSPATIWPACAPPPASSAAGATAGRARGRRGRRLPGGPYAVG